MDPTPTPTPANPAYRRRGKIAHLPKSVRDDLNSMLQDGLTYPEIIERLRPCTQDLNEVNLCNWKNGGYQDWLRENQIAQVIQAKHELAQSIVTRSGDDNSAGQAVLQIIASNLCEFLAQTDPATLRESLLSDADKFTRFVNAMVRLAEGGIKCGLHKFHAQDRSAEVASHKDPAVTPGISEESLLKAEQKLKLL